MVKKILLSGLTSALLFNMAEAKSNTGQILGNLETTKLYGVISSDGTVTNHSGKKTGEFNKPSSMVTLSDGSIWVVDNGNNRIQHISAIGEYLSKVGKLDGNGYGISGTEDGEFDEPNYIAKDSNDNIYVTDYKNNRIQVFKKDGTFIKTIVNDKFGNLLGIAVVDSNNIWVSDNSNHQVWKVDGKGVVLKRIGYEENSKYYSGSEDGKFNSPHDIEVDSDKSIWVADRINKRIQHFSEDGTFIEKINTKYEPFGLALDNHNIWVTFNDDKDDNIPYLYVYKKDNIIDGDADVFAVYNGNKNDSNKFDWYDARDIEIDGNTIWMADNGHHRIKRLKRDGKFEITHILSSGYKNLNGDYISSNYSDVPAFNKPHGISVDNDNNIWVVDEYGLKKYDQSGDNILYGSDNPMNSDSTFKGTGFTAGKYKGVKQLNIVNNTVYYSTADYDDNNKIHSYNLSGEHIKNISLTYNDKYYNGYYNYFRYIPIDSDGSLWQVFGNYIQKMDIDGNITKQIGLKVNGKFTNGSDDGEFTDASQIFIMGDDEDVYVNDYGNKRVEVFTKDGEFVKTIDGEENYITTRTIAPDGTQWSWWDPSTITQYDTTGKNIIRYIYTNNSDEMYSSNQDYFTRKHIAFDKDSNLWIADTGFNRISKYELGKEEIKETQPTLKAHIDINQNNTITVDAEGYDEDGYIKSYLWDFGDGSTADVAKTSHIYAKAGTYTLKVTVTDDTGLVTSVTQTLSVSSTTNSGVTVESNPMNYVYAYNPTDNSCMNFVTKDEVPSGWSQVVNCGVSGMYKQDTNQTENEILDQYYQTTTLNDGWNMVGIPENMNIDTLNTYFDEKVGIVWYWNNGWNATSTIEDIQKLIDTDSSIGKLDTLKTGMGVWIHTK